MPPHQEIRSIQDLTTWRPTIAKETRLTVIAPLMKRKKYALPPAWMAQEPAYELNTPPIRPNEAAAPTPVARMRHSLQNGSSSIAHNHHGEWDRAYLVGFSTASSIRSRDSQGRRI